VGVRGGAASRIPIGANLRQDSLLAINLSSGENRRALTGKFNFREPDFAGASTGAHPRDGRDTAKLAAGGPNGWRHPRL
jgi:hypothetical protein